MKSLFLAFCLISTAQTVSAELCSARPQVEPCTPDPGDKTDKAKRDIVDLILLAKKADPDVAAAKAKWLAVRNNSAISVEDQLAAFTPYRDQKMAQDHLFEDAMKAAQGLYHVHPDTERKTIAAPDDPAGAWSSNMSADWNPRVIESPYPFVKHAWAMKGNAKGGGKGADHLHFAGGVMDQTKYSGFTLPDGEVVILRATFDLALKNPGILARALFHETRHFNYLSRPSLDPQSKEPRGWSSKEEDERDAYTDDAYMAPVFGVDPAPLISLRDTYYRAAKSGHPRTSYYPTPSDESTWEGRYYDQQIDLDVEYQKLQSAVEKARKAAEEDARHRQEQIDQQTRIAQSETATADALNQCGVEPHYERLSADSDTGYFVGYTETRKNGDFRAFVFPEGQTIAEFKVSLMLMHSCEAVEPNLLGRSAESVGPPCSEESFALLKSHANDPIFLDKVSAVLVRLWGASNGTPHFLVNDYPCIADKIKRIRSSGNSQYERLFESEVKRNVKLNKESAAESGRRAEINRWNRENASQGARNTARRSGPTPADPCSYYDGIRFCPQGYR